MGAVSRQPCWLSGGTLSPLCSVARLAMYTMDSPPHPSIVRMRKSPFAKQRCAKVLKASSSSPKLFPGTRAPITVPAGGSFRSTPSTGRPRLERAIMFYKFKIFHKAKMKHVSKEKFLKGKHFQSSCFCVPMYLILNIYAYIIL